MTLPRWNIVGIYFELLNKMPEKLVVCTERKTNVKLHHLFPYKLRGVILTTLEASQTSSTNSWVPISVLRSWTIFHCHLNPHIFQRVGFGGYVVSDHF